MKIYYDKDIDYAEIFYKKVANYAEDLSAGIMVFRSEDNDEIVGYSFENASVTVFNFEWLSSKEKVAFEIKRARENGGLTQEQVIKRLRGASGRQFQRAEAGENISLDVLDEIKLALPEADFSKVFTSSREKIA